jgi:hypothetical protein
VSILDGRSFGESNTILLSWCCRREVGEVAVTIYGRTIIDRVYISTSPINTHHRQGSWPDWKNYRHSKLSSNPAGWARYYAKIRLLPSRALIELEVSVCPLPCILQVDRMCAGDCAWSGACQHGFDPRPACGHLELESAVLLLPGIHQANSM